MSDETRNTAHHTCASKPPRTYQENERRAWIQQNEVSCGIQCSFTNLLIFVGVCFPANSDDPSTSAVSHPQVRKAMVVCRHDPDILFLKFGEIQAAKIYQMS